MTFERVTVKKNERGLLLRNGDLASARKAFDLFRTIEMGTWSRPEAMRARQGRLRAMVASGSVHEAVVEAKEIERISDDPAVLIEAKFILAKAAEKALRKLVDDCLNALVHCGRR